MEMCKAGARDGKAGARDGGWEEMENVRKRQRFLTSKGFSLRDVFTLRKRDEITCS